VDRDDDLKIGIKTSAITLGRWDVLVIGLFYAAFLLVWTLVVMPRVAHAWAWWLGLARASGQAAWHLLLIRDRSREGCIQAFHLNHWEGFAVFGGLAAGLGM
jgi:4-hydroxybenzoate polyprenyltransferase